MSATLVWFRRDLRLQDNPALHAALARGGPVIPVFIGDGREGNADDPGRDAIRTAADGKPWRIGAASRWWLHHSLRALEASLRERGSRLIVAMGPAEPALLALARTSGASAVYWNRRYEPAGRKQDSEVEVTLAAAGLQTRNFNAALLHEPDTVANKQGRPFRVFSAYWRTCLAIPVRAPMKLAPGSLPAPASWAPSADVADLGLLPRVPWDAGLAETWTPGEASATKQLARFVASGLDRYDEERDLPACDGTSRLSAALHFGEISPRQIWAAVKARSKATGVFPPSRGARVFLSELGWREFGHHLLFHFPQSPHRPMRPEFERFPWASDPGGAKLRAWQRGRTGYPLVDAGMRQLWRTGWMHNRVRMVAASFLVKHLRLPWTLGAAWFWDTLVDADLANNTLGWQWSAGCGADAAPYFRVFAPVLQGRKFDPDGAYVRRWVPELVSLPPEFVHAPWEAPSSVLDRAGVRLGETYPRPVVDHASARAEALAAFRTLRSHPG